MFFPTKTYILESLLSRKVSDEEYEFWQFRDTFTSDNVGGWTTFENSRTNEAYRLEARWVGDDPYDGWDWYIVE